MTKLNSNKHRSLRLQKKLHVGEYKCMYSSFELLSDIDIDDNVCDLIGDVLSFVGGSFCFTIGKNKCEGGVDWLAKYGTTEIQQELLFKLSKIPNIKEVKISAPVDAWYYDGFDSDEEFDLISEIGTITWTK